MNKLFAVTIICCLGIIGCAQSQEPSKGEENTDITPTFVGNISTLYGSGGVITKDSHNIYQESDITWKDSLGVSHSLSELKGKVVVLNFWATWCTYCNYEMPDLQAIQDSIGKSDLVVIGVSVDRGTSIYSKVKTYVDVKKIQYQIIIDPKATTYFNYGCSSTLPWSFLIDRDGNIVTRYNGYDPTTSKAKLIEDIESIL